MIKRGKCERKPTKWSYINTGRSGQITGERREVPRQHGRDCTPQSEGGVAGNAGQRGTAQCVTTDSLPWAEMQQEEALHRVCARMERVTDGGEKYSYYLPKHWQGRCWPANLGWDVLRSMECVTLPEPQNFGPGDLKKG